MHRTLSKFERVRCNKVFGTYRNHVALQWKSFKRLSDGIIARAAFGLTYAAILASPIFSFILQMKSLPDHNRFKRSSNGIIARAAFGLT